MLKKILFLIALCCSLGLTAQAANLPKAFTLTPFYGGHLFEGNLPLDNSDFWGLGLGYNLNENWSLEAVYTRTNADGDPSSATDSTIETYRLDGLYHLWPKGKLVPYLAAGLGAITSDPDNGSSCEHLLVDYGVGVKYFILDDLIALRADVRHLLDFPEPDNSLQYSVGLTFQLGRPAPKAEPISAPEPKPAVVPLDSDGDGVVDSSDRCPNTPTGVAVDNNGCPLDSDKDGVYDYLDKCPGTPAGTPVDVNGCPLDSDKDGVYDQFDKCPGTPAGVAVDRNGCPLDTDGDGVYDYLDKCPGTPAGAPVDADGCPLDSDKDGVFDYLDQCPDTPPGVSVDAHGCPTTLTLRINFGHDSSKVGPEYDGEIAKAAQCINEYPGNIVYIDGHTDSSGAAEYNQKLSVQRATAVKNRLIEKFAIPAARMTARGFGEDKPVASNDTAAGRSLNRRVEVACGAKKQ